MPPLEMCNSSNASMVFRPHQRRYNSAVRSSTSAGKVVTCPRGERSIGKDSRLTIRSPAASYDTVPDRTEGVVWSQDRHACRAFSIRALCGHLSVEQFIYILAFRQERFTEFRETFCIPILCPSSAPRRNATLDNKPPRRGRRYKPDLANRDDKNP